MQPTLKEWLSRKKQKPRKRLRQVSAKRQSELRIYSERRLVFLAKHPWCQIWLAKRRITAAQLDANGCYLTPRGGTHAVIQCPRATEVHHKNGRHGWRLLDESEWCAASHDEHAWVKENQREARLIGVLR